MSRKIYKCTICGKEDVWCETWSRYGSILHEEECPNDMPIACCQKCQDEIAEAVKTGRFVLPEVKSWGYYGGVVRGRRGY